LKCEMCRLREAQKTPHHIISGNGRRRACETVESQIYLCLECHTLVHSGKGDKERTKLRIALQRTYFRQGRSEDEVRVLMGSLKLELDDKGEIAK
jgi:hypothetical protein